MRHRIVIADLAPGNHGVSRVAKKTIAVAAIGVLVALEDEPLDIFGDLVEARLALAELFLDGDPPRDLALQADIGASPNLQAR